MGLTGVEAAVSLEAMEVVLELSGRSRPAFPGPSLPSRKGAMPYIHLIRGSAGPTSWFPFNLFIHSEWAASKSRKHVTCLSPEWTSF